MNNVKLKIKRINNISCCYLEQILGKIYKDKNAEVQVFLNHLWLRLEQDNKLCDRCS